MAFVFRFAQLLQMAIHEETEVKNRLAVKDAQIASEEHEIKKLLDMRDQGFTDQSLALRSGNLDVFRMYPAYIHRLDRQREFHEEERERLQKQRAKIMAELVEKRRVRKIYEKLRERDEKRYQKRMEKIDQKRMDEFANRNAAVQRAQEPGG